jgi:protein-tyrosine phosphatase
VEALAGLLEARRQGEQVLVHCSAGSERTGLLVAFYRMLYQGWSGDRAYREYLDFRAHPPPKPKVSRYVRENWGTVARGLARRGWLDERPSPPSGFGPWQS